MTIIQTVYNWMFTAKQIGALPEINARRAAFQIGMQLEELSEKISSICRHGPERLGFCSEGLSQYADEFKRGDYDEAVRLALNDADNAEEFLDADIDLLWVTAGSLAAQGAKGDEAWAEVDAANWRKFPGGVATLDANGKVVKPAGWVPPDLSRYTFVGSQGEAP
jgi:predicted HAD superfamily Cof-like phosphohydrolase